MRCWIALRISTTTEAGQPACPMDAAMLQQAAASLALGLTPRVALVDEAVLMDVTASLRLFGGLARLMQLLVQRLEVFLGENGLRAEVQRAQGATSLIALGRLRVLGEGGAAVKKRVAELPMHTLTAACPHLGVLERIGCRTWDDLLRLPRDGVARRFGAELLQALDRARGSAPDDYEWLLLPEHFEEKLELNALVTHAPALMAGVERLLVQLHAWLLGRQSGLSALKITWHLDKRRDVPPTGELEVRTAQPAQDLRHVARLIAEHLAQQKLPAPVHSLTLQSLATELLADAAAATGSLLMEARQQGDSVVELVERLSARLGDARVRAWQPCADHRPELMQRWVPARGMIASISAQLVPARPGRTPSKGSKAASSSTPPEARTEALYPAWLLPEPIKLAAAGNNPVYQGPLRRLAGPQRLEAAEWLLAGSEAARQQPFSGLSAKPWALRDYFIYRTQQGGLLWIYSERLGATPEGARQRAWYLHGFFA
ncbi:DNA polymerase Y family protein [Polaromonas sp. JS666]|uniref:Y-family DNA polymerase n=1 Tax=Polaromonas sp. (strain JS666 / ATCC BAA-500) TaxID=296591 RepID=UPI00088909BE|nr:DNA polymerase Y family protein [Polaromonas sp. JS666]SDM47715.1 protein ImuB [Polaromonas sp. JS666]